MDTVALASASPRRRALLASLGLRVELVGSAYVETEQPGTPPAELALRHARGKAAHARSGLTLLVAADTVVDLDGQSLGKPRDTEEARAMLRRLSGRWHTVHTAFALVAPDGRLHDEIVSTLVRFAPLDEETIERYADSGDGLDKAGAYGIQGFAATLVERIDGDYFTVVGFPLAAFARALPALGYVLAIQGAPPEAARPPRSAWGPPADLAIALVPAHDSAALGPSP